MCFSYSTFVSKQINEISPCQPTYQPVSLSICASVCLSVSPNVSLDVFLSVSLSIALCVCRLPCIFGFEIIFFMSSLAKSSRSHTSRPRLSFVPLSPAARR
jgi:hypothetical protein